MHEQAPIEGGSDRVAIVGCLDAAPRIRRCGRRVVCLFRIVGTRAETPTIERTPETMEAFLVAASGRLAIVSERYLTKGSLVRVVGQLQGCRSNDRQRWRSRITATVRATDVVFFTIRKHDEAGSITGADAEELPF